MKAVFVLLDSLNRNYLPIYGNDWVQAPNIGRLAQHGVVHDNHWLGSAPCMPARRDILTGRMNFLERNWGPIEPFDVPLTRNLHRAGVRTHMETDHYHYFHVGGENYHTQFDTWRFHRGQERDCWQSSTRAPAEPDHLGQWSAQYALNARTFTSADEYPTPRTFLGAIDWLRANEGADDFLLWVEGFDPHEPFDSAPEYFERYADDWRGPLNLWSGYREAEGGPAGVAHLRRRYAGTLTMADAYLGKLMAELERQGVYEDTLIILTTDHGHLIGEHGFTGKNSSHVWNELGNLPFVVKLPGNRNAGERRSQLTQNIDVMPTLLDYFGAPCEHAIHGESLRGVLEQDAPVSREAALYGWFGMPVNVTDGLFTYMRAAARPENDPLYLHYQIPTTYSYHALPGAGMYRDAEFGAFLPYTNLPVVRARANMLRREIVAATQLFDLERDPGQERNLAGAGVEARYVELLRQTMAKMDAPPSQYERLGLASRR